MLGVVLASLGAVSYPIMMTVEDTVDMAGTDTTDIIIEDKEANGDFCSPHISAHTFIKYGSQGKHYPLPHDPLLPCFNGELAFQDRGHFSPKLGKVDFGVVAELIPAG
jgi:hypothetical protein